MYWVLTKRKNVKGGRRDVFHVLDSGIVNGYSFLYWRAERFDTKELAIEHKKCRGLRGYEPYLIEQKTTNQ